MFHASLSALRVCANESFRLLLFSVYLVGFKSILLFMDDIKKYGQYGNKIYIKKSINYAKKVKI